MNTQQEMFVDETEVVKTQEANVEGLRDRLNKERGLGLLPSVVIDKSLEDFVFNEDAQFRTEQVGSS